MQDSPRQPLPCPTRLLLALAGSGFSALVLEVLWTKHLSLLFGSTIWATGIVVATFMGGLALGGALFGRIADRTARPLRLYALLELGIALSALAFRPALHGVESLYVATHGAWSSTPLLSTSLLFGLSSLLLLPPTVCMGGTLPVVGSLLKRGEFAQGVSLLYAANVVGAAAGAFIAGYFLIPFCGLLWAEMIAYGINLAIAAYFFAQIRRSGDSPPVQTQAMVPEEEGSPFILVGTFLLGACALSLQLLWNRVLVLFLGSSTYAFAGILSVYLISMAVGGLGYIPLRRRFDRLATLFATLAILSALYLLVTVACYDQIPYALHFVNRHTHAWWLFVLAVLPVVFLVVGPPALLSGTLFPVAVALYAGERNPGARVGKVVLFNTLGGVVGSLLGAFWLVPGFGLQGGFKLIAVVLLVVGGGMIVANRHVTAVATLRWLGGGGLAAALLLAIPSSWDAKLMNSGIYYYAADYASAAALDARLARQELLANIEGVDATVAVKEDLESGHRFFTVNGKADGGTRDMDTQILLGQLPILIHPNPQDVLVVGLGTGVTLGTVTQYPARKIDCVEISPAVVEAADYFRAINLEPLADPRVEIHVRDARNFLLLAAGKYDVIVSEPSNPWQVGNANLFTREFFEIVKTRLNTGGIFCQWVPLYDLSRENLGVLLGTYVESFPGVHLFINGSDLFMVGAVDDAAPDFHYQGMASRLGRYFHRGLSVAETPAELLAGYYLFSGKAVAEFARGAALNTDLQPVLEYSSRYALSDKSLRTEWVRQNRGELFAVVAKDRQTLPLIGLGNSPEERNRIVQELMESFARKERGPMTIR